jgi:mannosyltransferase OCH1-like enzyme
MVASNPTDWRLVGWQGRPDTLATSSGVPNQIATAEYPSDPNEHYSMTIIPKKIHYVWFGGKPKPPMILDTIESWRRVLPDYEIIGWTEKNYNIEADPWMKSMHDQGKYAFASDYARLHILQEHGGIYLDTDVELMKPFDDFLDEEMFWGFEYDCYLATCVIGSTPGHPLINLLLAEYDNRTDAPINNSIVTSFFLRHFSEFRLNNTEQRLSGGIRVLPKEYFSVPSFNPAANYCRHHGSNLWRAGGKDKSAVKRIVRALLGEVLYFKLAAWNVCRRNEFLPIMREHRRRK